jgi:serine/threonine protein kinase
LQRELLKVRTMAFCVAPGCLHPENTDDREVCRSCGSKLLLAGRYLPLQLIGQGGFGKTFLAIDQQIPSQPQCVVKQLGIAHFSQEVLSKATELFYQEAQRLDELGHHPQIPRLLANFPQEQSFYLVQEFIAGETLHNLFNQTGEFTEPQIWSLLTKLLPVLQFIHEKNIIHRDIKPGNIMLRSTDQLPILIDFGIAKVLAETESNQTGTIIGTQDYMPPEQAFGKVFPASDLYSLGVTCLFLLTGERWRDMFDFREDRWLWQSYLPRGYRVSDRLEQVLYKLIHHKLNQRYQSAQQVIADLQGEENTREPSPLTLKYLGRTSRPYVPPSPPAATAISQPTPTPIFLETYHQENQVSGNPVHNSADISHLPTKFVGNNSQPAGAAPPLENLQSNPQLSPIVQTQQSEESANLNPIFSKGLSFDKLKVLLLKKKWQEADEETWDLLRKSVDKLHGNFLTVGDIDKIPAEDLYKIDELWSNYSQKRFGFTIQSLIYEDTEGDYPKFCQEVGWLTYQPTSLLNDGYKFTYQAPRGHLPSRRFIGGFEWWRHAEVMAAKLRKSYE